jgi:hypothetical protein
MKRFVFLAGIMLLFTTLSIHAEAKLLPAGTLITLPDGETMKLDASGFLLNRADMNAATIALTQAPVNAKEILDLHALSDKQQKTIDSAGKWQTWIGIGAFILGVVVDEVVKR